MLLARARGVFKWNLNFGAIALMWRGGCIIRSRFLGDIKKAFDRNPELTNLLLDDFFCKAIKQCQVRLCCLFCFSKIVKNKRMMEKWNRITTICGNEIAAIISQYLLYYSYCCCNFKMCSNCSTVSNHSSNVNIKADMHDFWYVFHQGVVLHVSKKAVAVTFLNWWTSWQSFSISQVKLKFIELVACGLCGWYNAWHSDSSIFNCHCFLRRPPAWSFARKSYPGDYLLLKFVF